MSLEIRALPGTGITNINPDTHEVEARVLSYGISDTYGTVWRSGCMKSSLEASPPIILAHHDHARPVGKVLDFRDGADHLELRIELADTEAVPDAKAIYSLLRSGIVKGWSVGFSRKDYSPVGENERAAFGSNPAKEFMNVAVLNEVSAVSLPAVPGTATLAVRSEDTIHVPTLDEILRLKAEGILSVEEVRAAMITLPSFREHITLIPAKPAEIEERQPDPTDTPAGAAVAPVETTEPVVATDTVTDPEARSDEDVDDAATLAAATAAAVREALHYFSECSDDEMRGLSDNARQAIALMQAGSVTVTDLLEVLGVPDDSEARSETGSETEVTEAETGAADATGEGETDVEARAELSMKAWDPKESDYTPAQWTAACLIPDKLPVLEPDGSPNKAAMASAAGRLGQTDADPAAIKSAAKTLLAMYGANKLKAPPSLLAACREVDGEDAEIRAMVLEADLDSLDDIFGKYAA